MINGQNIKVIWKSLKIVYFCPSVSNLLPGYAQSTTDQNKSWKDNPKQG